MPALKRRCAICHTAYAGGESFCPLDGGPITADDADELVGTTIDGRYLVTRLLGRGGMGTVYEADHVGLGKRVAIKVLADADADRDQRARLRQEARAASRIADEHVVRILDVGVDAGGRDYVVMEYVDGRDLDAVLRDGPLPAVRAIAIAQQVLLGLHACHAAGIVHRDIKPSNIRLTNDVDFVKIMDFGISKSLHANVAQTDTGTGRVIGTPQFMAPEQILDAPIDPRADVYAVGATLFAMLAGKPPFAGTSLAQRIDAIDAPPPSLDELRGGLPPMLVAAVARALAPSPEVRFPDVSAFASALRDAAAIADERAQAATKSIVARPRVSPDASDAHTGLARVPDRSRVLEEAGSTERAEKRVGSGLRKWWPIAIIVLLGAGVAAIVRNRETGVVASVPLPPDAALVASADAAVAVAIAPTDAAVAFGSIDAAGIDAAGIDEPTRNPTPRRTQRPRAAADLPAGTVIPVEPKGKPCRCQFRVSKGGLTYAYACASKDEQPRCECIRSNRSLCPFVITVTNGRRREPDGSRNGTIHCVDRTRPECDPTAPDMPASCYVKHRVAVEGESCSGYDLGQVETDRKIEGTYRCSICNRSPTAPKFYGNAGDVCIGYAPSGDKVSGTLKCDL